MMEFRQAHQKMFGRLTTNLESTTVTTKTTKSIEVSSVSTTTNNTNIQSGLSSSKNQKNLESSSLNCKSNESDTENINCNSSNFTVQQPPHQQPNNNLILTANTNANKIIAPPPLPKFNSINTGQDGTRKLERKLNTFGKLVIQNDNQNKLPTNVLPKNNLNGLNQNEANIKILRTSSPNKTNHKKGLAPKPPINSNENGRSNDKTAKIIMVNKKDDRMLSENLYLKNQNKLEGQKNGSVVDYNGGRNEQTNQTTVNNRSLEATYTTDLVSEKSNYLSASDISLSSSSIKS